MPSFLAPLNFKGTSASLEQCTLYLVVDMVTCVLTSTDSGCKMNTGCDMKCYYVTMVTVLMHM